MKVAYISGPIAGKEDLNGPLFRAAERRLISERNTAAMKYDLVIVPHDVPPWQHEGPCPGGYRSSPDSPHSAACYLREDLIHMLKYATDAWMLPGWEMSVGARLEMQVAAACGLPIHFFHPQDLGCAHNGHGPGKCDEENCWNYRVPNLASAIRRMNESARVIPADQTVAAIRRPHEVFPKGDVL